MSELTSLCLFFLALLKVGVMTGLGPAIGIAVVLQQVSGGEQLATLSDSAPTSSSLATSSPRNVLRRAA
jgi:hypothetical protein